MNRTPRRYVIAAATTVLAAFAALYAWWALGGEPPTPTVVYREMAIILALPTLVWLVASQLLIRHWWRSAAAHWSTLDSPGRLLAAATATLPERRREWGTAMAAELAVVQGRRARWRFAVSSAAAALRLPHAARRSMTALATAVLATVVVAGWVVGASVHGLVVFAVSFVGATVVVAVARGRGVRMAVPVPAGIVIGGVLAAVVATVTFLVELPTAAPYLSPPWAIFLAIVLASCLCVAAARPRSSTGSRLGPHLGALHALLFVGGLLLLARSDPAGQDGLLMWFIFVPPVTFAIPGFLAAAFGQSFRAGVHAGVWTAITIAPLTFGLTLFEVIRRYPLGGGSVLTGSAAPLGQHLSDALGMLWIVPMIGLPFAVIAAAGGALASESRQRSFVASHPAMPAGWQS